MDKLVTPELVCFNLEAETKEEVIRALAERMDAAGRLYDLEAYIADVFKREETYSTAVGFSVATPHAKTNAAKLTSIGFARLAKPIRWDEEETADLIFQLAVPESDRGDRHLQILATLSRRLIHADFRERIVAANTPEEIIGLIGDV